MAWNKGTDKSIRPVSTERKVLSPGAPVAYTPGQAGRPYKDGWNIERAYRDGVAKITWVMRAIDAIAGNQAKLPIRLRRGSIASGKVIEKHDLLEVLNSVANVGESSFAFRYRVSSQLLMSTRGVFIEVIRNRAGNVDSLHLLPPQSTAPIPHPTRFVTGFEVDMPDGGTKTINPDDVIWIRRPHPLDPYRSITPMEAAGIAIEVEQLAKIYNRNFLLNDGRPGGLLVLRGEIDPIDKEELQGRFRGNIRKAGSVSVISSDEGADFVDTGASPRDIAWAQMRSVTKEEILAAFGVPESIIGNASGRCLRRNELVRLADGSRVEAAKLIGQSFKLLTATDAGHVVVDAWATQEKHEPIYRTTTESGRTLETNGKHPLYAARYVRTKDMGWRSENGPGLIDQGWTPVSDLSVGHVVAVPSVIEPATVMNEVSTTEAFVLGALVGDRTMTGNGNPVGISVPPGEFADAFVEAVRELGDDVVCDKYGDKVEFWRVRGCPENREGSGRGAINSVATRVLLRRVGLMGTTSHTKFIPEEIFSGSNEIVASFLAGYFAADGNISVRESGSGKAPRSATISVTTVSDRLARDTQEILLRLGVNASIRRKAGRGGIPSMGDRVFESLEVSFSTAKDIINFCDYVTIPGKDATAVVASADAASQRKPHGGNVHRWRTKDLPPNLRWEKVASVEKLDDDDTVGIAVPVHHTYLSTFWEHNTFSNAAEEGKVFWQETMSPHLELLARSLDKLDKKYYINFNTETVPILILSKQESELHTLNEFGSGLISANEYRVATGRDPVDSELSDALLANPSLTPIGNTEKEMVSPAAPGAGPELPGDPNAEPQAQPDQTGLPIEVTQNNVPVMDSTQNPEIFGDNDPNTLQDVAVGAPKMVGGVETKTVEEDAENAEKAVARWEPIIERALEGFFVRQQRVISEKASSKKVTRALGSGTATVDMIFDDKVWNEQLADDLRPIYSKVIVEAAEGAGVKGQPDFDDVNSLVDEQIGRTEKINDTTKEDIATALFVAANLKNEDGTASDVNDKSRFLRLAVGAIYVDAEDKRKKGIAGNEAQTSYNSGTYLAGTKSVDSRGTWVTMQDDRVRREHAVLHGKTVSLGESFTKSGVLRFPGDPLGLPEQTIGCRCKLVIVG